MNWGWLLSFVLKILGFFGRGKGTRITFEARPESSIEKEKKALEELKKEAQEAKDALTKVTVEIAKAKSLHLNAYARTLDPKRRELLESYSRCRQAFLDAGGHADQIR